ncbi:bacteriohemerythrin [Propionivibrio sp.]|uniref:bacteriohemerythrin n=1 Tax=Propionivibrio sp. TaxID=2212460 RepID=UPI003BF2F381
MNNPLTVLPAPGKARVNEAVDIWPDVFVATTSLDAETWDGQWLDAGQNQHALHSRSRKSLSGCGLAAGMDHCLKCDGGVSSCLCHEQSRLETNHFPTSFSYRLSPKSMPLTKWSDKLACGLPRIDSQHKQLFDLASTFAGNGDQIRMMKTLVTLCEYVKVHFREEEQMLEALKYPDLVAHKRQHAEIKARLIKLLDYARTLSLDEIASEVQHLIYGWVSNHIAQVDAAFVPWVSSRPLADIELKNFSNPRRSFQRGDVQ